MGNSGSCLENRIPCLAETERKKLEAEGEVPPPPPGQGDDAEAEVPLNPLFKPLPSQRSKFELSEDDLKRTNKKAAAWQELYTEDGGKKTSSSSSWMEDTSSDDEDPAAGGKKDIYLDAAGKTPLLTAAAEAGRLAVGLKSKPWLMSGDDNDEMEEEIRAGFAKLVGSAAGGECVAICPSTAHAVSTAALNTRLAAPR